MVTLAGPAIPVVEQVLEDLETYGAARAIARAWRGEPMRAWDGYGTPAASSTTTPREDLRRITQPLLALFAGNDRLVYAEKNARLLRRYLEASRSPAWFIEVVPDANRRFRPSDTCESRVERRWADGFWDALNQPEFWLPDGPAALGVDLPPTPASSAHMWAPSVPRLTSRGSSGNRSVRSPHIPNEPQPRAMAEAALSPSPSLNYHHPTIAEPGCPSPADRSPSSSTSARR